MLRLNALKNANENGKCARFLARINHNAVGNVVNATISQRTHAFAKGSGKIQNNPYAKIPAGIPYLSESSMAQDYGRFLVGKIFKSTSVDY